jgi:hypothetical protein
MKDQLKEKKPLTPIYAITKDFIWHISDFQMKIGTFRTNAAPLLMDDVYHFIASQATVHWGCQVILKNSSMEIL